MTPARKGDGTGLSFPGYSEVRTGDGDVVWSAGADIPDSGVAQWTFDNTLSDDWGGNDGAFVGNPSYVTNSEVGDAALEFDGADDGVDVNTTTSFSNSDIETGFTVSCWVYPNALPDSSNIHFISLSDSDQWILGYNGSAGGDVWFWINGTSTFIDTSGDAIPIDQWSHIVGRYDGTDTTLFLNGNAEGSGSPGTETFTDEDVVSIGYRGGSNDRFFDGIIDDPRVYNKPLSDTEVDNLYNTGSIDG